MRTWFIKQGYLHEDAMGLLVVKSKGEDFQRIDNIQVTIDHLNDCTLEYDRLHFYHSVHSPANFVYAEFSSRVDETLPPLASNIQVSDVEPQYVIEKFYTYSKGFWLWRKTITKSYFIVAEGLVRKNIPPTHHVSQGNRWLIESRTGDVTTNI